ncbi:hypothetical protein IC582_013607 [Cucumis melo]
MDEQTLIGVLTAFTLAQRQILLTLELLMNNNKRLPNHLITGYYYLCDTGYPNAEGFLAPYRGQRYHLQEWRGAANAPTNAKEYFNMKHSSARNVIERSFGVLKGRWAILRGKSYYPLQVQCRTILACALLHNLINREMTYCDDVEDEDEGDSTYATTTA